jgi:hypothetical protein
MTDRKRDIHGLSEEKMNPFVLIGFILDVSTQ